VSVTPRTSSGTHPNAEPRPHVPQRVAAVPADAPLEVVPWSRYGKHRLYVNTADGRQVGWLDLDTGARNLAMPDRAEAFEAAISAPRTDTRRDAPRRALIESPSVPGPITAPNRSHVPPVAPRGAGRATPPYPPMTLGPGGPSPARWTPPESPSAPPPAPPPPPVGRHTSVAPHLWAPPVGPPAVADLATNRPGVQLEAQVQLAHEAGQRPTFLRRVLLGKRAYSSWELGAIGERLVACELDRLVSLGQGWAYLNSIPVGANDSDIDHLVIGPGGIFTLNAKHHPRGRVWVGGNVVMVNGTRHPYVRNSRFEAQRASKLLSAATGIGVTVQGLVVPVGASSFTVKQQPEAVHVVNRSRLVQYLASREPVLNAAAVAHILGYARLGSTWRAAGSRTPSR